MSSPSRAPEQGEAGGSTESSGAPSSPVGSALDSIRRLIRGLRIAEQRTRAASGLSAAQLFVLQQLTAAHAASLSDLAERTMTDRSSVTAVVERLASAGLVTTTRDPRDRRRVMVEITEKGTRMLGEAPAAPTTLLITALESMAPDDLSATADSLRRLVEAMGLAHEPAVMLFEDQSPQPTSAS